MPGRDREPTTVAPSTVSKNLGWAQITLDLDNQGFALIDRLIDPEECRSLVALYSESERFRSRVIMASHGYGRGEYQYFADPLPNSVTALREQLYPGLAAIANRWNERLGNSERFPDSLNDFRAQCRAAGQTKPTPLLLKYEAGDYNCLHQDLYGDLVFPLQVAVLLSQPDQDFTGGEFVLTEQRPRMQSRAEVVPLRQGSAVVFPVHHRPVKGTRGDYRMNMRHGVSRIRSGERYTLGLIFHDAR